MDPLAALRAHFAQIDRFALEEECAPADLAPSEPRPAAGPARALPAPQSPARPAIRECLEARVSPPAPCTPLRCAPLSRSLAPPAATYSRKRPGPSPIADSSDPSNDDDAAADAALSAPLRTYRRSRPRRRVDPVPAPEAVAPVPTPLVHCARRARPRARPSDAGAEQLRRLSSHFLEVDALELAEETPTKLITARRPAARSAAEQDAHLRRLFPEEAGRYDDYAAALRALGVDPEPFAAMTAVPQNIRMIFEAPHSELRSSE